MSDFKIPTVYRPTWPNDHVQQVKDGGAFGGKVNELLRQHWVRTSQEMDPIAAAFAVLAEDYNSRRGE